VANVSRVADWLWTGGDIRPEPDAAVEDIHALQRLGITHVLDCRIEWTDEALFAVFAPGVAYLHHGVDDDGGRPPDWWFDLGVGFAVSALAEPDSQVLVHCHMGINRGPSMAYAVLLALEWDPVDALETIRAARPIAAVGYAEHALDWHHRRRSVNGADRHADRARLARWREDNDIDVASIIRGIRTEEGTRYR
jgi:dual specificity phosphatase 3